MVGMERLYQLIQRADFHQLTEEFRPVYGNVMPFDNILGYITNDLNCQTALIEKEYIDKDYRNEFSNLYSKMFKRFDTYCTRIHFFKGEVKQLTDIQEKDKSFLGYCGYMVIRPTDVGKVGRTIIEPRILDANCHFILCAADFESHVLGREFQTHASPYIQADSMVMCCAHSAMWASTRYMNKKFGFEEFLPYEISENAYKYMALSSRILPVEGLTALEMFNAFINMGYSPTMYSKPQRYTYDTDDKFKEDLVKWTPERWIYRYIESKFPVVALFPNHATTIIGHTLSHNRPNILSKSYKHIWDAHKVATTILHADTFVDGFITNDSLLGPYRIVPVKERDKDSLINKDMGNLLISSKTGSPYDSLEDLQGFIVPLPEKIYILAEHIDDIIKGLIFEGKYPQAIRQYLGKMAVGRNMSALEFLKSLRETNNPLVFRAYSVASKEYKSQIATQWQSTGMHQEVVTAYLKLHMSKFIWVIEISNAEYWGKDKTNDRKIFGEILIDSTANKLGLSFLSIHLPGVLIIRDVQKDQTLSEPKFIEDDGVYGIINRT